ncbi:arfGAP with SH3 domain, ANK repeat and PH domain-containing protein isoform X2 [Thrips palmi]|uniref:ArfGAP with SH3 domain, ANK repeat and PH domain-containing protein isoform X2 n=1 Tax=Thrips palmi TaxID=161013 RepID=A0A6P8ZVP9_THRPL|nr:arfGAP with SH3 domain, ANK repeat and PH domain-containing protein isoform X2 [Thrips palmi]
MPGLISVNEFVEETREDYNSPTTSTFVSRMPQCRTTVCQLEETLDIDRDGLTKMKKAIKAIHNSGNSHVDNEMYLSRSLHKLGDTAIERDHEPDIGAAFMKFAVVTKELSALMKTLMQNANNIVMFPVESLLKGDLRGVKGDLKRPFDRAWKDYEAKYTKIEKEKKAQAKEAGLIRTEITAPEVAEEMEKERRLFQLQMCEYLIKVNEIKTKKGIELLQHLVEYYHAQTNYFQDGLKTIEHFGSYVADLSMKLQKIRQKQDEERRRLNELRTLLRNAPGLEKENHRMHEFPQQSRGNPPVVGPEKAPERAERVANSTNDRGTDKSGGYSLHQLQATDKQAGITRTGHLLKKSEGKMRRVWQKRKCCVQAEGFLDICHADESKPPTKVNLLTCQIKLVPDDKRCFDLISYNRTYHFQAEDEADQRAWMSVLVNCKEGALHRAFDDSGKSGGSKINPSLLELQQAIIRYVQKLPGNDSCCDCNSQNDATWLSTNFGIIVCIECSGIHREMGVHISRIQSLTLDNVGTSQLLLARHMTNNAFNEVMEASLPCPKLSPSSTMEERYEYIRAKYVDKKFALQTYADERDLQSDLEHAVNNKNLYHLLQVFAEGVDLGSPLPTSDIGETALHLAVVRELGHSLHIVDFLVQNMPSQAIDRVTSSFNGPSTPAGTPGSGQHSPISNTRGGNSALHLCAIHDRVECMKLLIRSGADPMLKNAMDKTALDLAQERGHHSCEELLRHALQRQKSVFDNINIDWNLSHDEGSTDDVSEDETVIEDRNGCCTPEKKSRSRPPSYAGAGRESPVNIRSRSSTCDSLKSGSSPNTYRQSMAPPPPPQNRKPSIVTGANAHGSLKKRAAPMPPMYGTLPSNSSHSRTPSDPLLQLQGYHTLSHHKRSPSSESGSHTSQLAASGNRGSIPSAIHLVGAKLVIPPGEAPMLKSSSMDKSGVRRPVGPPPPVPPLGPGPGLVSGGGGNLPLRMSNGRSTESISSVSSDMEQAVLGVGTNLHNPVPPPRKPYFYCPLPQQQPPPPGSPHGSPSDMEMSPNPNHSNHSLRGMVTASVPSTLAPRKCRALYDCEADNEDELSFREGEVIIVTNEHTDDENWMEGALERAPDIRGMFPISFVHMLSE